MRRLLTTENKRSIKEAFRRNAVFRVIDAAYKEQETRMETLRFSPEEIFVNCFMGFDSFLKHRGHAEEIAQRMWSDIFCELRDDALEVSRQYGNGELEAATSCILYTIIACMMASEDWELIKHTETLMRQIAAHSAPGDVTSPLDDSIEPGFVSYVQKYIATGKYISRELQSPKNYADPINPLLSPLDRTKAKEGVRKRLEFMKGALPGTERLIMAERDFTTMIEAVEYLIENNVVKKQEKKLRTGMPEGHLRYTFYLVYKNEGKCADRQLWLDFLSETFSQMQDNRASLSNHFSDKPSGYDVYAGTKKRK